VSAPETSAIGGSPGSSLEGPPEGLVKMSALARQSGVPAATIKHYIREGLLPEPPCRTSRNMAWYDPALVPRIQAIKAIQRTRFLPLRVIKEVLDESSVGTTSSAGETAAEAALTRSLERLAPRDRRTHAELVAAGMPADQLAELGRFGVVTPLEGSGESAVYGGDDLAILQTLGAARRAGITPAMLPHTILEPYVRALAELVRVELTLFRTGIVPRAGADLEPIVDAATELSERLVVLLRRKLLLPMLKELKEEASMRPCSSSS
jgi:DNA-binding transcriptional MerR regulator